MKKLLFSLLLLTLPFQLLAQGEDYQDFFDMSLEELLEVKITTASRSERSIQDLPVSIHVITREEILNNNYATLVDALKDVPGIKVSQPGSGMQGELFIMRGFKGNEYAKILVNGMPIQPSVNGDLAITEHVNIKNLERIEILYGPASALYGADALAGVINLITYNPTENSTRIETIVGQDYYYGSFFSNWKINENLSLKVYGALANRDDLNLDKDSDVFGETNLFGGEVEIGDLPEENRNFGFEVLYKNFHLNYENSYRNNHSSIGQTTDYYLYDNPDLIWGQTTQRLVLKHRLEMDKLKLNSNVSYLRDRLDTESAFGMIFYETPLYKYQACDDLLLEEIVIYDFNEKLEIVGGLSYQYSGAMPKTNDLIKPFDEDFYKPFSTDLPEQGIYQSAVLGDFGFNPITDNNLGAFIQLTYSVKDFIIVGGGRYDDHSEYGNSFNPRISGLYNLSKSTSIRASYSEAFKAPTSYHIYNSIALDNGDGTIYYLAIPNRDLESEGFSAFEVGLRSILNEDISMELIGYRNKITGLLSPGFLPIDPAEYPNAYVPSDSAQAPQTEAGVYVNDSDAESILNGVDLIVKFRNIYEPLNLNMDVNFSYMKGEETLPNGDEIEDFRKTPEIMAKYGINFRPIENLYLRVDNLYCSDWYPYHITSKDDYENSENKNDGFFTMDVGANYKIPLSFGNLGIHFKVKNLFDEEYAGIDAYGSGLLKYNPQYQRTIVGGIEFNF